jgi:hypothetical protein
VLIKPEDAFRWITRSGGHWDNYSGLIFLIEEAENTFGVDSIQYRTLILLWQLRELNEISNQLTVLKPKISYISQSFETII